MVDELESEERLEIVKRLFACMGNNGWLRQMDSILRKELKKVERKEREVAQLIKTVRSLHGYDRCLVAVLTKDELVGKEVYFAKRVTKDFDRYRVLYRLALQEINSMDFYGYGKKETGEAIYLVVHDNPYFEEFNVDFRQQHYDKNDIILRVEVPKSDEYAKPTFSYPYSNPYRMNLYFEDECLSPSGFYVR